MIDFYAKFGNGVSPSPCGSRFAPRGRAMRKTHGRYDLTAARQSGMVAVRWAVGHSGNGSNGDDKHGSTARLRFGRGNAAGQAKGAGGPDPSHGHDGGVG